jgi:imidazolonepropionase-like amidohydrolase
LTEGVPALVPLVYRPELIIDGRADAPLRNHEVVVGNGTILAVRPAAPGAPQDGELVELPGVTILPGLIDCHVHYTIDASPDVDGIPRGAVDPPERVVLVGARNARLALAAGVTTARSAGSSRGLDIALAAAIEAGDVPGPQLIPAGSAVTITGGHGQHFGIEVDSMSDMIAAVRRLARDGAQVIKLVASEAAMLTSGLAGVQELTSTEMTAMTREARRLHRRVLAHAQSSSAVLAAAEAGVDSVEHAFLADAAALQKLKDSGAFLTPTLTVTDVYSTLPGRSDAVTRRQAEISSQHRASCEMAIAMGIPVVAGTDCGVRAVFPDMLSREIVLLHDHGLSAMGAIRAATVNAARLLGLAAEIGTVEPGKRADLIGVAGDPTADLRLLAAPVLVMQEGNVIVRRQT